MQDRLAEIDEKLKQPHYDDPLPDLIWLRQRFADVSKKLRQLQLEQFRQIQQMRRTYQLEADYLPQPDTEEDR